MECTQFVLVHVVCGSSHDSCRSMDNVHVSIVEYYITPCLTDERVVELESKLCESEESLRREQGSRLEAERRERDLTQEQQQIARDVQILRQEKEGLLECRPFTKSQRFI